MKSFNEIYAEVLKSNKTDLEVLRKRYFNRIVLCAIAIFVLVMVGVYFSGSEASGLIYISIAVCIVLIVIFLLGPANAYRRIYKEKVVKTFIQAYDENLQFYYEKGIPSAVYREGHFEHYDRYESEDLIIGKVDGHDMMMGEVHTESETEDSDGKRSYTTIFHGLFGMCKLNNSYHGMVKIHADKGVLGKVFQNKKRIEMDSSEFEKYFDVIADDKIQAMQILTSDIMDKMILFIKQSKLKYELTIRENKLYIRFKTGAMFEGNIIKSSVDFDTLKKVYDIINFTFDITRALVKVTDETDF